MSDALASNDTLERPSQDGQVGRASGEQPQSGTDGQTSDNGKSAQVDENIRKLQSTYDKKIAEERKAFQAQQQQMQQHIRSLELQMRETQKNSAPDDYSRLEMELQWLKQERDQYATAYQQTIQQQQAEQARQTALREVADEFGVSPRDLEDATDYISAVKLAVKVQRDREKRKQRDDEQRASDNMPDVGVGAPRTAKGDAEREWDELVRTKDSAGQARWLRLYGGKK